MVSNGGALHKMVEALAKEPLVAVDTESNSLFAYREQVCLIQFSTPRADYLVDPLALSNLAPLAPIFANPAIEKVFHAAEYDLICLRRDFGFQFASLFDTMLAASILGRSEFGLGAMLESHFGVALDKRCQRANWAERPLPAHLLSYAMLDTHYLIPLREILRQELQEKGLWGLAEEDFNRLQKINGRENENGAGRCNENGPVDVFRVSGSYDLPPQKAAVLLELCRYRDQAAQRLNRPLFKVLGDATLLAIASACPSSLAELKKIKGMSESQVRRHGGAVLEAVRRGSQAPPVLPPRSSRPDEAYLKRLEALRQWRKTTAEGLGVKSDVVLPKDVMEAVAKGNPRSLTELGELMEEVPWRLEQFGERMMMALGYIV